MLAIEIAEPGGPEVLRPVERVRPSPAPGEVLIRVRAAGVNRPDLLQREGAYPPPPGASDLPGLEVAGLIEAVGDRVDRWRVGDTICALVNGGGYAEFCVAPAGQCLPIPEGSGYTAAAALPETFFTVWTNVFDRGRLEAGETLLVHGGAGGIGTTAIQLGAAFGARVIVTAGSAVKCAACESLGAVRAIDYRREDFVAVTRTFTGGRGADLILDIVGADYVRRNIAALAMNGRLVMIGFMKGVQAEIDITPILQRRLILTGSTLRPRSTEEKAEIAQALYERVWPLIQRGSIKPVIHRTFPLEAAADAHRMMEANEHVGKIVLTVDGDG
ncbi:MAG: NAD(P)H-quinone oxidoreductase [Acidobacteria bacterium]|nr:NAD(P)H-quinone oxidoreductase [Acidobacteriota bacterium]